MDIVLAHDFYPLQWITGLQAEFKDELNVEIKEIGKIDYTIELKGKTIDTNLENLTGNFLNRLLEIAIIEKY